MTQDTQSEKNHPDYNPLFDEHLKGLGGWLVIVGIGIMYTLFANLYFILMNVIANGGWSILMKPFSELNFAAINWVSVIEVILSFVAIVLLIQLVILYFFKKKNFPKWYIGLKILTLIIILLDAYFIYYEMPYSKEFRDQINLKLAVSIIAACIWIPYMLFSKRVKFTFIE